MAKKSDVVVTITGFSQSQKKITDRDYEKVGEILGDGLKTYKEGLLKDLDKNASISVKGFSYVYEQEKQILTTGLSMGWNRYTSLKEDYISENRLNNLKTSISKVKSLSSSTLQASSLGKMAGMAVGGPIGAAVGSVLGTVAGVVTWGVKNEQQNRQKLQGYYKQLNETNFQTYLDSSRAGLVDNGRGTEN